MRRPARGKICCCRSTRVAQRDRENPHYSIASSTGYFEQRSDTGLKLDLLQKYLFIPLDIFGQNIQNEDIRSETEAWLAFLSQDDPEMILRLIEGYPEFRPMYEDVYRLCQNVEKIMGIFSEELRILDRNTVQYMMDEMQAELDSQKEEIENQKEEIKNQKEEIEDQKEKIEKQKKMLNDRDVQIGDKDAEIERLRKIIKEMQK